MKLTIQMFQELDQVSKLELDEIEKSQMLIRVLTGKPVHELENMPVKKYNALCKRINEAFNLQNDEMMKAKPKNLIKTNGRWYWLNYDIAKPPMNAGRYVELATFSDDFIGNLHKIMATMATPVRFTWRGFKPEQKRSHEEIANDMLQLEFKHAYHSAVFFWGVFSKSILNSRNYFLSIAKDKKQMEQVLKDLQNISDGFTPARWYQNLKISV